MQNSNNPSGGPFSYPLVPPIRTTSETESGSSAHASGGSSAQVSSQDEAVPNQNPDVPAENLEAPQTPAAVPSLSQDAEFAETLNLLDNLNLDQRTTQTDMQGEASTSMATQTDMQASTSTATQTDMRGEASTSAQPRDPDRYFRDTGMRRQDSWVTLTESSDKEVWIEPSRNTTETAEQSQTSEISIPPSPANPLNLGPASSSDPEHEIGPGPVNPAPLDEGIEAPAPLNEAGEAAAPIPEVQAVEQEIQAAEQGAAPAEQEAGPVQAGPSGLYDPSGLPPTFDWTGNRHRPTPRAFGQQGPGREDPAFEQSLLDPEGELVLTREYDLREAPQCSVAVPATINTPLTRSLLTSRLEFTITAQMFGIFAVLLAFFSFVWPRRRK